MVKSDIVASSHNTFSLFSALFGCPNLNKPSNSLHILLCFSGSAVVGTVLTREKTN